MKGYHTLLLVTLLLNPLSIAAHGSRSHARHEALARRLAGDEERIEPRPSSSNHHLDLDRIQLPNKLHRPHEQRQVVRPPGGGDALPSSPTSQEPAVTTPASPSTTPGPVTTTPPVTSIPDTTTSTEVPITTTSTTSESSETPTTSSTRESTSETPSSSFTPTTSETPSSTSETDDVATRTATNAEGSVIVVTEIETLSTSSSKSSVAPVTATIHETLSAGNSTSSAKSDKKDDPPLSTGAIVGISVGGGVAVLALVGFIIWKFKQKRFGSFDDDDADGIKWPELNRNGDEAMNLPLPAKPTGGHGFETNALERGRTDLDGNPIGGEDDYDDYVPYPVSHAPSVGDGGVPYYHDPSPPLHTSNMSYADSGVYGSDSAGVGVTRNPSVGASTTLYGASSADHSMGLGADLSRNRSLGGSAAYDSMQQDPHDYIEPQHEMVEMNRAGQGVLNRSTSGRMLH